jgi:hypothetical protein
MGTAAELILGSHWWRLMLLSLYIIWHCVCAMGVCWIDFGRSILANTSLC